MSRLRRYILPGILILGFVFSLAADYLPIVNSYTRFVLITIGINIILCTSLNLVNGYMGEFWVGHAGFMELGAYAAALLTTKWAIHTPGALLLSIVFGGLVAALIGVLLALLSFKTRGDYLAIITMAFLMIVKSTAENISYVGGPRGMLGIQNFTTLTWTFVCTVAAVWVIRN